MRAHQIMTRNVVTASPTMTLDAAANLMVAHNISGLPVLSSDGHLIGIVSDSDFMHRKEIGTQRKRSKWLQFFLGKETSPYNFVREQGRLVQDVMTESPITATEDTSLDDVVDLMETGKVKRLPVVRGKTLVGIVTRSNLMRMVANLSRDVPDPTADDDHIRQRIFSALESHSWQPYGLSVFVKRGIVQLYGMVFESYAREASVVAIRNIAGVKEVHDHMLLIDSYSGYYFQSAEDKAAGAPSPN